VSESESELMQAYGITSEQICIYRYGNYKYTNLKDAINYAKRDSSEGNTSGALATDGSLASADNQKNK